MFSNQHETGTCSALQRHYKSSEDKNPAPESRLGTDFALYQGRSTKKIKRGDRMLDCKKIADVKATERVKRLRQAVIDAKPILCSERALSVTESYKQTEDEHAIFRRAKAFARILDEITIHIWDEELIVGNHGKNGRRCAPVFPEFATEWLIDELDSELETRKQDTFIVPQEVKDDLKSIFPYWQGKTVFNKYRALLPEETKKVRDAYMFSRDLFERNGYGHTCYQLEKLMTIGIEGLRAEVKERMADLDLTNPEDFERNCFYEGLLLCFDAVVRYANRFGALAQSMAEQEQDAARKAELERIAAVCVWVPEHPARDTWEALQVIQFMQIILQLETSGDSVSPGRMDQYLYPFFKKDIESGKFDLNQIQELYDCMWIKFNEIVKAQDTESIYIHPGFPMTPNVTAGGLTAQGEDATNELSFVMLNCQEHIRLTNPQFTVRIHDNTPESFKERVAEIIEYGTGMPALFGDNTCMAAIQKTFPDMPIENVRDYSIVGCIELAPKNFQGRVNGGQINVARVVDLAMNNGIDRLTGQQLGLQTGDPNSFTSFDDLFEAVEKQMKYFVHHQVVNALVVDYIQRENTPHLFLSSLIDGCIRKGKDMTRGGSSWGATPILLAGLATASNSLTAVRDKVFDKKEISMSALNAVLDQNFDGEQGEEMRTALLDEPKYGTDNSYADEVMTRLTDKFFEIIESHRDIDGRPYTIMILTLGGTVPHGWKTGATADGRKATMPVSDSMSPANEGKSEGPTAALLSASKIDQSHVMQCNVLNLKFTKTAIESRESKKKLMDMVSVYFDKLHGQEVQFNVVSTDTLRDAQKHPENYQDLIIRVAGYSARFVELASDLQNDIIARAEHEAV